MSDNSGISREERLALELLRTRWVWNNFIHNLCHGNYPVRTDPNTPEQFKGSDDDRLYQILKVTDFEVGHIDRVLQEIGLASITVPPDEEIFDRVSRSTGITENSHESG